MLECIRVLIETPEWSPLHAAIFRESSLYPYHTFGRTWLTGALRAVFNNAEESLQDGSHLFSTQHEIADTVRAAINLEGVSSSHVSPTLG